MTRAAGSSRGSNSFPERMLSTPALAAVNHVLRGDDWARARLANFAGQTARLEFGRVVLCVAILESGLLGAGEASSPATVSIRLPDDAPVRALSDRSSLLAAATISGSVELAEALGFVLRNLRWDVEHDLAQLLGDIVARRTLQVAKGLAQWQARSAGNFAFGLAEYLSEEEAAIAPRRAVECFCSDVDALRDDFARFEQRLRRIELRQMPRPRI